LFLLAKTPEGKHKLSRAQLLAQQS